MDNIEKYHELYGMAFKILKRYLADMDRADAAWFNRFRNEFQILYEQYMELDKDLVYLFCNLSVFFLYREYDKLRASVEEISEARQLSILDFMKGAL